MKYITLPQNKQVIVDDEDYEELSKYKWHLSNGYAVRHVSTKPDIREYMHRKINDTPKGLVTDHINGNKLDNRKSNLRTATVSQNAMNSGKLSNTTNPYRGVSLHKKTGLWRARIQIDGKAWTVGYYKTPEEARDVYAVAAEAFFGNFVRAGYI